MLIALYSSTSAPEQALDATSAGYVKRPLPGELQPGHVLDARDMADLRQLLGDRDNRIAMQYREISKLMTLVRAPERGLAGSMLYAARRLHARMLGRQRERRPRSAVTRGESLFGDTQTRPATPYAQQQSPPP